MAAYAALFDPQTCGGLLIGVPQERAESLCNRLVETGDAAARVIGRVIAPRDGPRRLLILDS